MMSSSLPQYQPQTPNSHGTYQLVTLDPETPNVLGAIANLTWRLEIWVFMSIKRDYLLTTNLRWRRYLWHHSSFETYFTSTGRIWYVENNTEHRLQNTEKETTFQHHSLTLNRTCARLLPKVRLSIKALITQINFLHFCVAFDLL